MGTMEGLLTFHKFWPQGGAGGKNLEHPKKVLYYFLARLSNVQKELLLQYYRWRRHPQM